MARVMVVDDAKFMIMTISKMVEEAGHVVIGSAENGMEAVKQYQELKPDIVTMDITMPEMDGLSAVKEIISIDPNAKIIMCSAMGQQSMVLEAIQNGAKDFLVKPFDKIRVAEALQKLA